MKPKLHLKKNHVFNIKEHMYWKNIIVMNFGCMICRENEVEGYARSSLSCLPPQVNKKKKKSYNTKQR